MKRKEIGQIWQHWQDKEQNSSVLKGVYDVKVWKLSDKQNVPLMMKIDWFQPFKHRNDY